MFATLFLALANLTEIHPGQTKDAPEYSQEAGKSLVEAVGRDDVERVRALLLDGADANSVSDSKTWGDSYPVACLAKSSEVLRLLLLAGADPNSTDPNGSTPMDHVLIRARAGLVWGGGPENIDRMVRMLFAAGADPDLSHHNGKWPSDPDDHGRTSTWLAGYVEGLKLSMAPWFVTARSSLAIPKTRSNAAGPPSDSELVDELFYAVRDKNAGEVRRLLKAGADPNALDEDGRLPLEYCFEAPIAEILLLAGADPHRMDADGIPALFYLLGELRIGGEWNLTTFVPLLKALLVHGGDLSVVDRDGRTLLDNMNPGTGGSKWPSGFFTGLGIKRTKPPTTSTS